MYSSSSKCNKLLEYVKQQHGDQERKYTMEPYWMHCIAVADMVSSIPLGRESALCHDLIEDTACELIDLENHLKEIRYSEEEVSTIVTTVDYLTDVYTREAFPNLNRKQRKKLEAERMVHTSKLAQIIKCCDMIDNTKSIVAHDRNFAKVYLKEKKYLLSKMKKCTDTVHYKVCKSTLEHGQRLLSAHR